MKEETKKKPSRPARSTAKKKAAVTPLPPADDEENFSLRLSASLGKKLRQKAADEGVSVEDMCSELLAEGLVLRAWEIMERKSAMRGNSNAQQQHRGGQRGGGGFNSNQRNNNRNRNHNRRTDYKNIMEDNASFMEYVRNQEKR